MAKELGTSQEETLELIQVACRRAAGRESFGLILIQEDSQTGALSLNLVGMLGTKGGSESEVPLGCPRTVLIVSDCTLCKRPSGVPKVSVW